MRFLMSFFGHLLALVVGTLSLFFLVFLPPTPSSVLGLGSVFVFSVYAATVFALRCGEESRRQRNREGP